MQGQPYGSPYVSEQPYGSPYASEQPYGSPYASEQPYGSPYPGGPRVNPATGEVDAPNTGLMILSFFFPGVGLILYLVWNDKMPQKAHSCGKGALIGFIVGVALTILITIISILIPLIIVGMSLR